MNELSLNEILTKIKTNDTIPIWAPSLKTNIEFKPLTFAQQRTIIDKISSTGYGLVDFFIGVNEIIKANCVDQTVYSKLTTIDRTNIVITLRRVLTQIYQDIDLQKLLDKNMSIELPTVLKVIETEKFNFEVSVPTLIEDTKYNQYLTTNYKDETQLLGKLLVTELCKFINKITVIESNTVIDLKGQSTRNKWTIVESIETKYLKQIFDYITLIRNTEEEFVKCDDKQLNIGPELFIV